MPAPEDDPHAAQERLLREARATAGALLAWLEPRLDGGAPGGDGRPPQSPGPCSWCPVCALAAALRGEQPELTARLVDQAAGAVALLRLLVQAHGADPSAHQPGHDHGDGHRPDLGDRPGHDHSRGPEPDLGADGAGPVPAGGAPPPGGPSVQRIPVRRVSSGASAR